MVHGAMIRMHSEVFVSNAKARLGPGAGAAAPGTGGRGGTVGQGSSARPAVPLSHRLTSPGATKAEPARAHPQAVEA